MLLKFSNETDWLAARKKDITSTQFASLFGLSQYKSRLQLWHEKAGNVEDDFEENAFSIWGKRLQISVGMGICEDRGWAGFDLTGFYFTDPELRIGSSMDFKAVCPNAGAGILETKVAENFSEDQGWFEDRAPIDYEFQIQGQLHMAAKNNAGIQWGAIGTLGRRQSTRVYVRTYDADLGKMIDDEAGSFWESIRKGEPPRPDYTVDGKLLERLRKSIRNDVVNLSANNRAQHLVGEYLSFKERLKALNDEINMIEKKRGAIRDELHDIIGRNETAIIGDYQVGARVQTVEDKVINAYEFRRLDIKKRRR